MQHFVSAFLQEGLAALLVHHYLEHDLPWPDLIVPMPTTKLSGFINGKPPAWAVAKRAASLMSVPFVPALKSIGILEAAAYRLSTCIEDRKVLLISQARDAAFFNAGEALMAGYPKMILGAGLFC